MLWHVICKKLVFFFKDRNYILLQSSCTFIHHNLVIFPFKNKRTLGYNILPFNFFFFLMRSSMAMDTFSKLSTRGPDIPCSEFHGNLLRILSIIFGQIPVRIPLSPDLSFSETDTKNMSETRQEVAITKVGLFFL